MKTREEILENNCDYKVTEIVNSSHKNTVLDMPCRCDCGKWFDLDDGYPSKNSNKIICKECSDAEDDEEIDT